MTGSSSFLSRGLPGLAGAALLVLGVRGAGAQVAVPTDTTGLPYQERFAELDGEGARVHYLTAGKGAEALVFLHDWRGDVSYWTRQIAAFPDRRVIAIDLPGHGASDQPSVAYTMDYFARSVDAVLQDAGVSRVVLVGYGMGAFVGRQFYRLFPEKTAGLVLVSTSLQDRRIAPDSVIRGLHHNYYYYLAPSSFYNRLPLEDVGLEDHIREVMLATPRDIAISSMKGLLDPKIYRHDRIGVPVLAVLPRGTVPNQYDNFHRSIAPRLEIRTIPSIYDLVMISEPAAFNDALASFVARNRLLAPNRLLVP
jgi:pimeloyl-ACP methyl ester carboxylesterase